MNNNLLPNIYQAFAPFRDLFNRFSYQFSKTPLGEWMPEEKRNLYVIALLFDLLLIVLVGLHGFAPAQQAVASITAPVQPLTPLEDGKQTGEVMGFAPFWTINKLDNVDFDTLTTLAYFSIPVTASGDLDRTDQGYTVFKSKKATELFKKAHAHGTRVVLTITQMKNGPILALLDSPEAQKRAIEQTVAEVQERGIDGVNIDLEYGGNPGPAYRNKFSKFVSDLTEEMHRQNPNSKVTVSVYAASAKHPKMYDIGAIAQNSDGVFMMAYDFAVAGADQAMPTAPLYGHKEGRYWYDISTAVDDFLAVMPAYKLILGVPWYGYNYAVYQPEIKATTRPNNWRGKPATQTYAIAKENVKPGAPFVTDYQEGWDDLGQVGWKAYYRTDTGTWRMIFLEDTRSLAIKYDFAKEKKLAGVGMWALGFDAGQDEMWQLLREKFGIKLADHSLISKAIAEDNL